MTDKEQTYIFQKNLLGFLNEYKKTQLEVANAIGVSHQTFNTWCRGIALPRMGKIQLLADYFHINKSDLIEEHTPDLEPTPKAESFSTLETELIHRFRKADEFDQTAVLRILKLEKNADASDSLEGTG